MILAGILSQKKNLIFGFLFIVLSLSTQNSFGKTLNLDICVADDLKINVVRGVVVLDNQTVIDNLPVKISKDVLGEPIIAETKTNDKGEFIFPEIKKGKYFLTIRAEGLESLTVLLKVKKHPSNKPQIGLKVTMGILIPGECSSAKTAVYNGGK